APSVPPPSVHPCWPERPDAGRVSAWRTYTLPPGPDHPTECAARQSWWMRARLFSGSLLLPPVVRQPAFAPTGPVPQLLAERSFVQEIDASSEASSDRFNVPSLQYSLPHLLGLSTKCP